MKRYMFVYSCACVALSCATHSPICVVLNTLFALYWFEAHS